jgi:RsiW-degrading membrane proteinase PrsW (M82 family)
MPLAHHASRDRYMLKWFGIALLLSFSWRTALGQAPALDTFTSSHGTFRFVYPQTTTS